MKTIPTVAGLLFVFAASAQQHFAGAATSQGAGMIQAGINPAEYANLGSTYEVSIFAVSANAANNKIGFDDLFGKTNFEDLIFRGNQPVNLRFDGEIYGPGFAYKIDKWAFAITSKAYTKLDLVDVDPNIGDAVSTATISAILDGTTTLSNKFNQRINGTSWGEIGLSAARNVFDDGMNKISVGGTFKLLFPGSYANFGADRFTGTIHNNLGDITLTDAHVNLNIAYSGKLGDNFTDFSDYTQSLFGRLNGVAADIGVNYRLTDNDTKDGYRINAGLSLRNIGGMTFKSANNSSTNYVLSINGLESLDLNQFQDVDNLKDVENKLLASGYLNKTTNKATDFKVKLPTVFSAYADVKIVPSVYASVFVQQKLNGDDANDQISYQNIISVTPRYVLRNFEVWSAWSDNEISGISGGLGLRFHGFYLGSGSIITNIVSNNKQADAYVGYSFGLY